MFDDSRSFHLFFRPLEMEHQPGYRYVGYVLQSHQFSSDLSGNGIPARSLPCSKCLAEASQFSSDLSQWVHQPPVTRYAPNVFEACLMSPPHLPAGLAGDVRLDVCLSCGVSPRRGAVPPRFPPVRLPLCDVCPEGRPSMRFLRSAPRSRSRARSRGRWGSSRGSSPRSACPGGGCGRGRRGLEKREDLETEVPSVARVAPSAGFTAQGGSRCPPRASRVWGRCRSRALGRPGSRRSGPGLGPSRLTWPPRSG